MLYRRLEEEEELPNPMARMRPPIIPERPVPIVPADGYAAVFQAWSLALVASWQGRSYVKLAG